MPRDLVAKLGTKKCDADDGKKILLRTRPSVYFERSGRDEGCARNPGTVEGIHLD